MKEITERQKEVLTFISAYSEENSFPPTVREISDHFGISIRAIQDHLVALQKKGYISQQQNRSRSLKVLSDLREKENKTVMAKIPVLGTVAAGKPLLSEENLDGYINLSEPFIRSGKNYFALRVRGQSMINAGILDGDLAIIEQTNVAMDGQIIVAVLDDAITLKRYFKETERVRLQPENPDFKPIYCQDVRIVGILSNILRTY